MQVKRKNTSDECNAKRQMINQEAAEVVPTPPVDTPKWRQILDKSTSKKCPCEGSGALGPLSKNKSSRVFLPTLVEFIQHYGLKSDDWIGPQELAYLAEDNDVDLEQCTTSGELGWMHIDQGRDQDEWSCTELKIPYLYMSWRLKKQLESIGSWVLCDGDLSSFNGGECDEGTREMISLTQMKEGVMKRAGKVHRPKNCTLRVKAQ
jgi:hypothetical protein